MVTISPYGVPRSTACRTPARWPAASRTARTCRPLDLVTAVTAAALCASSAPALDEAGVLRTAVAQQRRSSRAGPR